MPQIGHDFTRAVSGGLSAVGPGPCPGVHGGLCGAGSGQAEYGGTRRGGATRGDWGGVGAWRDLTAGTWSVRFLGGDTRLPVLQARNAA